MKNNVRDYAIAAVIYYVLLVGVGFGLTALFCWGVGIAAPSFAITTFVLTMALLYISAFNQIIGSIAKGASAK